MLMERDYMKSQPASKRRTATLTAKRRLPKRTLTQWTNIIILILASGLIGFILSRILR